jgi:integration host factor subunit alpha
MAGRTLTRADLYDAVYHAAGASAKEAREIVELVLAEIVDALARDETVKLASFGTFSTRNKRARVGRNPKTGDVVPITPRRVVAFRPSQVLKGRIQHALAENSLPVQRLSSPPAPEPAVGGGTTGANHGRSPTLRASY